MTIKLSLMSLCVAMFSFAWAFPTQQELEHAVDVVDVLVKEDIDKANAGKIKHVDVAEKIRALVEQASSEEAKWILLKYAFIQYAKGLEYDKAADVILQILAEFPDVPPATALSLIRNNTARANSKNSVKLLKLRDMFLMRQKCQRVLANPKSSKLLKAEATCLSGDWVNGLKMLVQVGGDVGKMAQEEMTNPKSIAKVADYWWNYESKLDTCGAFRSHAVELYKQGISKNTLDGLYKTIAEKRIAEVAECDVVNASSCKRSGLLHRWSFNGNLVDSVTGQKSKIMGKTELKKGEVITPGIGDDRDEGGIDLGEGLLPGNKAFTFEIWARQIRYLPWARLFSLHYDGECKPNYKNQVSLHLHCSAPRSIIVLPFKEYSCSVNFQNGVLYHFVFVGEQNKNGRLDVTYYLASESEETLVPMVKHSNCTWTSDTKMLQLGRDGAAISYDEVRIWDSALSLERLNSLHKDGPNKIP